MLDSTLFVSIMLVVLGVLFTVIGIMYLTKTGPQYRKMAETKSDAYVRNFGILFTVLGILLVIAGILDIFVL
jgi:uncharacterized membrane protein